MSEGMYKRLIYSMFTPSLRQTLGTWTYNCKSDVEGVVNLVNKKGQARTRLTVCGFRTLVRIRPYCYGEALEVTFYIYNRTSCRYSYVITDFKEEACLKTYKCLLFAHMNVYIYLTDGDDF